jgi:hypothetical protein
VSSLPSARWDTRYPYGKGWSFLARSRLRDAAEILDGTVLSPELVPFLTIPAYQYLDT